MKLHEVVDAVSDSMPLIAILVNNMLDKGEVIKMHAPSLTPHEQDYEEVRVDCISIEDGKAYASFEMKNEFGDYQWEKEELSNPDKWTVTKSKGSKEWWLHEA